MCLLVSFFPHIEGRVINSFVSIKYFVFIHQLPFTLITLPWTLIKSAEHSAEIINFTEFTISSLPVRSGWPLYTRTWENC